MNRDWMRQRLERFRAACEEYDQENRRSGFNGSPRAEQLNSEINSAVPTVREIVKLLAPDLVERIKPPSHMLGASEAGDAAEQALGILRDQDEWKANLAPDAPSSVAASSTPPCGMLRPRSGTPEATGSRSSRVPSPCQRTSRPRPFQDWQSASWSTRCSHRLTPCRARRGFTSRGTRRARPGGRARMGCTCSLKEHSRELGTWRRIPGASGQSRSPWSSWPCCR